MGGLRTRSFRLNPRLSTYDGTVGSRSVRLTASRASRLKRAWTRFPIGRFFVWRARFTFKVFWLCTAILGTAWFGDESAMSRLHVVAQFAIRIVPTVAYSTGDSGRFWLCHLWLPPKPSLPPLMVRFYLRPSRTGDNGNRTFRLWKNLKAVENVQGWNERQKDKGKSGKASGPPYESAGAPWATEAVAGEFLGTTLLFGKLYA